MNFVFFSIIASIKSICPATSIGRSIDRRAKYIFCISIAEVNVPYSSTHFQEFLQIKRKCNLFIWFNRLQERNPNIGPVGINLIFGFRRVKQVERLSWNFRARILFRASLIPRLGTNLTANRFRLEYHFSEGHSISRNYRRMHESRFSYDYVCQYYIELLRGNFYYIVLTRT